MERFENQMEQLVRNLSYSDFATPGRAKIVTMFLFAID